MASQNVTTKEPTITNGVNVTQLFDTIEAIRSNSEIAKFQFRAKNQWVDGGLNRTSIKEFYGACKEDDTRQEPFVLDADEPAIFCGKDQAANPVEFILHALAGCMTTTLVYHAASRGIEIEAVDSELEGDIDLHGFLGLSEDVRNGYQAIRVNMRVKSEATPAQLTKLAKFSPVYDIVSNSLPVDVVIETY